MNRHIVLTATILLLGACGGGGGSSASDTPEPTSVVLDPAPIVVVDEEGTTAISPDDLLEQLTLIPINPITDAQAQSLQFMGEEEKLAKDLYLLFFELWGQKIFSNIANAEQTHIDAVASLLERYELPNSAPLESGSFENLELQGLYDFLAASGSISLVDALMAAAEVEEVDIVDLERFLTTLEQLEEHGDIILVYENLNKGSRNHLRSFVKNINNQGFVYVPRHLDQARFDEIIAGEIEKGS